MDYICDPTKKRESFMTISYNWLCDYLPVKIEPERLSHILTSVGLEVEGLEHYEAVRGSLKGLVIGEVLECGPHPNADKLKLTRVNAGGPEPLSIVCGAANVAAGQKVVVALPGTTIYPVDGDPVALKVAKIRGVESHGMICAEDEIGLGESHAGILVLPAEARVGMPAAEYFKPYTDTLIGIGLTPNHMDAMSHWGVARDVCAWLSHHENKNYGPKPPSTDGFKISENSLPVGITILNRKSCERYSGLTIKGITIKESPRWMQDRLKAIGIRSINNIVDITNFVLHELGQPLHAFDLDAIKGREIVVKNLPEGTPFVTLDGKERKLSAEDLMICDAEGGLAMAGVFGGLHSGIGISTRNIFLESAWFNPTDIRKTSFRHGLRTDAALHFEKGMDISGTVHALKRAAVLIRDLAGGEIASKVVDAYPDPKKKTGVVLKFHYLKKLSGKDYQPDAVRKILQSLGFEVKVIDESADGIHVLVPWHKPDISMPADIVEEIMRIDGLDNIEIPAALTISPSVENNPSQASWRRETASWLVGQGFSEILTNSITNSAYYSVEELGSAVRMINNLSAELNIMRPSMLETGLESIGYNLNRKSGRLKFFEFGKTYSSGGVGDYREVNHLCLYLTGDLMGQGWKEKGKPVDFYYLKGLCERLFEIVGLDFGEWGELANPKLAAGLAVRLNDEILLEAGFVNGGSLRQFDIRQEVLFADIRWDSLMAKASARKIEFRELPRQLAVYRDLAMIVRKSLPYDRVEKAVRSIRLDKLRRITLFDIFESERLGTDKKSLALSLTFLDEEKTLTDKEIDAMVEKIMTTLEREVQAEIRK
jgi:phenylalanyl-tRNA synthetase beta chain